jgi:hypothetical protein
MLLYLHICKYKFIFAIQLYFIMLDWNDKVKRLLKAELMLRGISNSNLAELFSASGIEETKSSIDSKISRGTFSASFFIQSLALIGCEKVEVIDYQNQISIAAEPSSNYKLESEK